MGDKKMAILKPETSVNPLTLVQDQPSLPEFVVVHGLPGVGKTTFGASCPAPIFIKTEEGAGRLKYKSFPRAKSYDDVLEQLKALWTETHEYKTLVIDTITGVEELIKKHLCDVNGWSSVDEPAYGAGTKSTYPLFEKILNICISLREVRGMNIVLLAHSEIKSFTPPTSASYDRFQLQLLKGNHDNLMAAAETILFFNNKILVRKEKGKANSIGLHAYSVESPAAIAKNRYNLPHDVLLPDSGGFDFFFNNKNKNKD